MKLPRIKKKKKLPLVVMVGFLIVAAGLGYWWLRSASSEKDANPVTQPTSLTRKVNDVDYSPPTDQDKNAQEQQKDSIIQQATGSAGSAANLSVSISRVSQAGAGQPLIIHTVVSGASTGTCDVTLSKDGQADVVKSFPVTVEATYSTCSNAQIAASDIPADGTWKLQVTVVSGASSSPPATLNVAVAR